MHMLARRQIGRHALHRNAHIANNRLLAKVLTYGGNTHKLPHMIKRQVYFQDEEFVLLQQTARRSGRSVADLVREAVRRVWLDSEPKGPVALWGGPVRIPSTEHDSIYDRPE
ncbi:MAG: ribbon-helix-helix domain-containing protein [Gammaproteobacteria bacterium]|nr:ribbon-helix-helix domain-containing protein [Gammaproteobacteria bacterium]MDE0508549.1 ribbon-helix-helix domain-containing protein [Gammaproteobacteria bacterium]MXY90118.1 hypothetical protein [Gammaproteobacteria bacterium]MYA68341.1 hypothetical protein [Gammaproteobacteria bacterium]MYC59835.1 hypothetical protein [Gammaproteobacteria bacterium]